MTTDKKLKATIRERMAATGENYAAARLAVLRERAPAQPAERGVGRTDARGRVYHADPFDMPMYRRDR